MKQQQKRKTSRTNCSRLWPIVCVCMLFASSSSSATSRLNITRFHLVIYLLINMTKILINNSCQMMISY